MAGLLHPLRFNSRLTELGARCTLRAIARSVQPCSRLTTNHAIHPQDGGAGHALEAASLPTERLLCAPEMYRVFPNVLARVRRMSSKVGLYCTPMVDVAEIPGPIDFKLLHVYHIR